MEKRFESGSGLLSSVANELAPRADLGGDATLGVALQASGGYLAGEGLNPELGGPSFVKERETEIDSVAKSEE